MLIATVRATAHTTADLLTCPLVSWSPVKYTSIADLETLSEPAGLAIQLRYILGLDIVLVRRRRSSGTCQSPSGFHIVDETTQEGLKIMIYIVIIIMIN